MLTQFSKREGAVRKLLVAEECARDREAKLSKDVHVMRMERDAARSEKDWRSWQEPQASHSVKR